MSMVIVGVSVSSQKACTHSDQAYSSLGRLTRR